MNDNDFQPFLWLRGDADVDGDTITLPVSCSHLYAPCFHVSGGSGSTWASSATIQPTEGALLFDLAGLSRPVRAKDALEFVSNHGLLWHGPDSSPLMENYADWEEEVSALYGLLKRYRGLQTGLTEEEMESEAQGVSEEEMEDSIAQKTPVASANPPVESGLEIAAQINRRLAKASPRLVPASQLRFEWVQKRPKAAVTELHPPTGLNPQRRTRGRGYIPADLMLRDAHVSDLVTYAYFEFSVLIEKRARLGQCVECRRFFILRDERKQFCSPRCRARVQARRHYARKVK